MTRSDLMDRLRERIPNTEDTAILNAPVTLKALIATLELCGVLEHDSANEPCTEHGIGITKATCPLCQHGLRQGATPPGQYKGGTC